jgi:hypothetical protein
MTSKKYFVNNGGQNLGPYEMDAIISMVDKAELKATDHVYVEEKSDWVMICQHPEFLARFEKEKPKGKLGIPGAMAVPPQPSGKGEVDTMQPAARGLVNEVIKHVDLTHDSDFEVHTITHTNTQTQTKKNIAVPTGTGEQEWYVLKGKDRFGPFSYLDLVHMLQEKSLFEYDYVWRQGMATWARIAESTEFTPDRIRELVAKGDSKVTQVFFRRRHDRWKYECPLIVHDNTRIWKGRTQELSEGGAGVIMENAMLVPGQNIYIHFKPGSQSKPFNVLCEVVSKKYIQGVRVPDAPIVYGLKFINIHKQDRDELKSLQDAAS